MPSKVPFMTALIFAFLALGTYVMLLGPAAAHTALGTITGKKFKPAGTHWQYPVGADRSLRAATKIPIAEAYVFEIAADGLQSPLFFSSNVVASREFEVGQRVRIVYRRRGLPFIWSRIFVEKIVPENH
jgi:hypothetical protein